MPTLCLLCVIGCALVQSVLCAKNNDRLQFIIGEMENCCNRTESYVQEILQHYVDKLKNYYGAFTFWVYFDAGMFICGPYVLHQSLPIVLDYPFPIEDYPMHHIVYGHQAITAIQCAGRLCVNNLIGLLLWFSAARFEILTTEFRMVTDVRSFVKCIKQHQILLRFVEEVIHVVRFLILSEIGFGTIRLVLSGIVFFRPYPTMIKVQFFIVNASTLISAFISILPADKLMDLNQTVSRAAYECLWYEMPHIKKLLAILLTRCQKTLVVSVGCFIPAASLAYYRAYVSTAASYFTVLRMMLEEGNA
ncbi:hypothetical protein KM043_013363 [Ampulex compressa]|nr:hypothetical protein KM043_013363 [Ampulex compressa]